MTLDAATLEKLFRTMVMIRRFDEKTTELFTTGLGQDDIARAIRSLF